MPTMDTTTDANMNTRHALTADHSDADMPSCCTVGDQQQHKQRKQNQRGAGQRRTGSAGRHQHRPRPVDYNTTAWETSTYASHTVRPHMHATGPCSRRLALAATSPLQWTRFQ